MNGENLWKTCGQCGKTCGQPVQNREKTTALKACKPADPEGKSEGDLSHSKAENIG